MCIATVSYNVMVATDSVLLNAALTSEASASGIHCDDARLFICLPVAFLHCCTYRDVTLENGMGCPLVMYCWVDFQSVYGFSCYDNICAYCKMSERMDVLNIDVVRKGI